MIPLIQYGLGVYEDGVYIRYQDTEKGKEKRRLIKSVDDFATFIKLRSKKAKCNPDDFIIMCSSSMDFPKEYTNNKKVIALARALR